MPRNRPHIRRAPCAAPDCSQPVVYAGRLQPGQEITHPACLARAREVVDSLGMLAYVDVLVEELDRRAVARALAVFAHSLRAIVREAEKAEDAELAALIAADEAAATSAQLAQQAA